MKGGAGGGRGGVQVRRGKNPRQGESLDKDQRQNKQYNYEQARSTRHAGRPADLRVCAWYILSIRVISNTKSKLGSYKNPSSDGIPKIQP